ncbi:hypothetical protein BD324DRAFT_632818 [Kockovaella imperatae]|uniref:Cryptic loci regulator 2 N-terminal domain-containing protein n=1 Tax=Kockovaella imperatae TaxID=4999 RepID=A0A1Y1UBL0_9TREE|nr:hypothetical protein BD324DRAFT_632818 [Kockovaella imperatae]ORX35433.1 hypothetical protein BD324DRAFT_632818 [Kockovaella imperatae]
MPSYTPGLEWPRSDGDQTTWPSGDELKPSTSSNWWKKCEAPHDKIELYEAKIGKLVADKLGIKAASYRMPLPPGYALFEHHKPQPGGGERVDTYLRGCPHIGRRQFRSTNEFQPHVLWLMDTSKPLGDHTTCACIYNNSSEAAKAKKAGHGTGTPTAGVKRPAGGASPTKRQKKAATDPVDDEFDGKSGIIPERALDMKTHRRFRKGELVWFRVQTINPPASASSTSSSKTSLPPITHWPGLVANIVTKARSDPSAANVAGASLSTAWSIVGGKVPEALQTARTTYTYEYHVRPLGLFNPASEVVETSDNLLPWAMGKELLGGPKGWDMLGKEGTRILQEGVAKELEQDKLNGVSMPTDEQGWDERWRNNWAQRWGFKEKPLAWDLAAFRLSLGLKIAVNITNCWTQTDKIDLIPGADINPEDLQAITAQRKTLYQGLWWGGERLWLEDMVRLKRKRGDLPSEDLGEPSEAGALGRAVMFKIRMITLEISPDSTPEQHSWRCLLYGDVFEVVNYQSDKPATWVIAQNGTEESLTLTHPAAKGYSYHQLNDAGSEVTVDIMDVAGRIYHDLLEPTTQKWFTSTSLSNESNRTRTPPGDVAQALAGLKPGSTVESKSERWKEDLFTIVTQSNKLAENQMRKFYMRLVNPAVATTNTAAANGGVTDGDVAMRESTNGAGASQ